MRAPQHSPKENIPEVTKNGVLPIPPKGHKSPWGTGGRGVRGFCALELGFGASALRRFEGAFLGDCLFRGRKLVGGDQVVRALARP